MAAQIHKPAEILDPVTDQPLNLATSNGASVPKVKSNFLKRMCMWRRV